MATEFVQARLRSASGIFLSVGRFPPLALTANKRNSAAFAAAALLHHKRKGVHFGVSARHPVAEQAALNTQVPGT